MTPSRDALSNAIASHLGHGVPRVVWIDAGDEVLVHLDALAASRRDGVLVVRVDLEADEIGRERVTLPFALGEDASRRLVATTSEAVRGGPLAARWGAILQDAIVDALGSLRRDRRRRGGAALDSIVVRRGRRR